MDKEKILELAKNNASRGKEFENKESTRSNLFALLAALIVGACLFFVEFCLKSQLTQVQLAKKVGSSKNTISSIETGRFCPTAYLAALLCLALNCKFEELFYFDED